jgi:hypothetical protein
MPDDKSLGKRILGLFVEDVPADDSETRTADGEAPSAADEIAAIARQSGPLTPGAPLGRTAASASLPPSLSSSELVAPVKVDFDAVFKNAGIDPQALDRVRKAEDLLKNLPDSASAEVKRQIVEASLKAFGFEISKIVEGVQTQTRALEAYVRVNEQQTGKAITDAQAQIAKLEDQVITLRADIDKRTNALAGLSAAADVRKRQVLKVLEFFHPAAPAALAGEPAASKTDE